MQIVKRLYSTIARKRFYKTVETISSGDNQFEICLDGKKVKTPKGNIVKIPSRPLALAVAQEWDCQKDKVQMNEMHLTGLAITSIDNPMKSTEKSLVDLVMNYLDTDAILYMHEEPEKLAKLERKHWGEIINWAKKHYEIELGPTSTLASAHVPDETKEKLRRHLATYNFWSLIGYQYAVESLKSVLLTMATVQCRLNVEEAVRLSSLEQEYQTKFWGRVEWAHDFEYHELCSRLAAATFFINVNSSHEKVKKKIGTH